MSVRTGPALDRVSPRSDPQQERSRLRQQALLDAAEEILGEVGAEGLKMREVARRANLPIASVYHYFPSSPALMRTLVERLLDDLRAILTEGVMRAASASNSPDAERALVAIIDTAADFMDRRPNIPAVWGAMRASPELRALDVSDTEANAAFLAPAVGALLPNATAEDVEALALVVIEAVVASLQLGCDLAPPKRARVRAALREFVATAMRGLMEKYR